MFLEAINGIESLKQVKLENLPELCNEIRQALIKKISQKGGHLAPNLGVVELTTAIHYVFNSPIDKVVFDVSHQCYTHKILTGRKEAFINENNYGDVNGFSNPFESEHDLFTIGHTSTALSLGCGLAKARDIKGENYNIIAVVGDGSLSGGQAYEGLNNIAEQNTNFIVIINDNEMSIAENHGGYYKNLENLRNTQGKAKDNLFKALGFDYLYLDSGNDVLALVQTLTKVKDAKKPIVVHVHTQKGKGLKFAETYREKFHSGGPFSVETGEYLHTGGESYSQITYEYLSKKMAEDSKVVVITSGTPTVVGMTEERRKKAGKQFVDVGICEEHAVAFASGIAKGGAKAVYPVFGSFIQRSFDQIHQDLALDNNPATMLLFLDGVYGMGGSTHNGLFDIAQLSNIPNLVYLAPTCKGEYLSMLDWSIDQDKYSVAIRVPIKVVNGTGYSTDYSKINKSIVTNFGEKVAIIGVGSMYQLAKEVTDDLISKGINPTLINPVYLSGLDETLLASLTKNHSLIVTIEEGVLEGGFGFKVASFLGDSKVKVKNFGLKKGVYGDYNPQKLLEENNLTAKSIFEYILQNL